ncbi:MAG TPA: hypothetical protein VFG20_18155 [Planctomycetaceae bacterium]|jgi:type II secretory pathway component PulJ|nr:hypothetical protein [Planctomycetaceae bacterium]
MNRRGKSLVELLVVISMLGAILGTTGTVIHRLMRAERAVETDLQRNRTLTSLAEQFRSDVHAATRAEVADEGRGLTLTLPSATVTYAINGRGVLRTLKAPEGVPQLQEYRCNESGLRFATQEDQGRIWATVTVPHVPTPLTKSVSPPPTVPLEVRAAIGRFAASPAQEGVT